MFACCTSTQGIALTPKLRAAAGIPLVSSSSYLRHFGLKSLRGVFGWRVLCNALRSQDKSTAEGLAGCLLPKAELTACSVLVALKMCAREICSALRREGEECLYCSSELSLQLAAPTRVRLLYLSDGCSISLHLAVIRPGLRPCHAISFEICISKHCFYS